METKHHTRRKNDERDVEQQDPTRPSSSTCEDDIRRHRAGTEDRESNTSEYALEKVNSMPQNVYDAP